MCDRLRHGQTVDSFARTFSAKADIPYWWVHAVALDAQTYLCPNAVNRNM